MTKIKTADASGAVLDWLVAKCEGADVGIISPGWVVKASCSVFDNLRAHIKLNGGSIYATEADAQAWAGFNKWCRGGGV